MSETPETRAPASVTETEKVTAKATVEKKGPKKLSLSFDQEFQSSQYVGRSSIAQLMQALTYAHDRLVFRKRSPFEQKLMDEMQRSLVRPIVRVHRACSDFDDTDDIQFRVLEDLFYRTPHKPVLASYRAKDEMGKPSLGALISALENRFTNLAYRYSNRTYRGRSWAWFGAVVDFLEEMAATFETANKRFREMFEEYIEEKKKLDGDRPKKSKKSPTKTKPKPGKKSTGNRVEVTQTAQPTETTAETTTVAETAGEMAATQLAEEAVTQLAEETGAEVVAEATVEVVTDTEGHVTGYSTTVVAETVEPVETGETGEADETGSPVEPVETEEPTQTAAPAEEEQNTEEQTTADPPQLVEQSEEEPTVEVVEEELTGDEGSPVETSTEPEAPASA